MIYSEHQDRSSAMDFGTAVHKELEEYHDLHPTEESERIKDVLLEQVPLRNSAVRAEVNFEIETSDLTYQGTIDVLDLRDPKVVRLYDYKTTSAFKNALTENKLYDDLQMNFYAWVVSQLTSEQGADVVEWSHVQISKKSNEGVRRIEANKTCHELNEWATSTLEPILIRMRKAWVEPVEKSELNQLACFDYRRPCHFMPTCNLVEMKKGLRVLGG